jgi:predicted nucleic acid-binding protein
VAVYFFDSSAIVKRYVREVGTAWVCSITEPAAGHRIYVTRIAGVEVVSALSRQGRSGNLSAAALATAMAQFRQDFAHQYHAVEITATLIARAMTLAETHALRGYDAVQCAAALEVHTSRRAFGMSTLTLVCADGALNAAATAEGLLVADPNEHP